jgi:hypothetical protein
MPLSSLLSDSPSEIDSSRTWRGFVAFLFVAAGLAVVVVEVMLRRLLEVDVLVSGRFRLRCDAGAVKKLDMFFCGSAAMVRCCNAIS